MSSAHTKPTLFSGTTRTLVGRLWQSYVRRYIPYLALSVFFMLIIAGATGAMPVALEFIVNDVFIGRDLSKLYLIMGGLFVLFLIKGVSAYGESVSMTYVGQRIVTDIQVDLFKHIIRQDLAFFHANPSGTLISRFTNDVGLMRHIVSTAITSVGKDTFKLIALVGVMIYEDWRLALISLVGFPLMVIPIRRVSRRMRKVSTTTQKEVGFFTTLLGQVFQGARLVKAYTMEGYEIGRISGVAETLFSLTLKGIRTKALLHPLMEMLGGLAILIVLFYGGLQVIEGTRTAGTFVAFIGALLTVYEPMKSLANFNANIQEGLAATQRVFEVMDAHPLIQNKLHAKKILAATGALAFQDVSFAYRPDAPNVLDHVTFSVEPGQKIAFVGPSGGGKSTLLNLIPRFYDVGSGTVLLDGTPIPDLDILSLRQNIALVSQEVVLFDDTIRANIAYGSLSASDAEIKTAAVAAAAADFIEALPEGYDTLVGEQGVRLSGGQRQRIAIARAMLKNAPILLLDEATSALDTTSERIVQTALDRLMKGRTTLIVAHRLSTIRDADYIYVLEGGKIIEAGTHDTLIAQNGLYAQLNALQFQSEEGENA